MNNMNLKYLFYFIVITLISRSIFSKISTIKIKIEKSGINSIFFAGSYQFCSKVTYPDEVYINNKKQNKVKDKYTFEQNDNIILLKWNKTLNNIGCMFRECKTITEVDLSEFDSSNINIMNFLFDLCSSLKKVIFSNFDTSKVNDMACIFEGCSSLVSVNLTNFDTNRVSMFHYMFWGCTNLKFLNLSNFKNTKINLIYYMFYNCQSLTSLILPNIVLEGASKVENFFGNCNKLKYIDMENVKIDSNFLNNNKDSINSNQYICTHSYKLMELIKNKNAKLNCKENWCENHYTDDNCFSLGYKYEYNSKFYEKCPNGTYDNNYKCLKCDIKCNLCNKESMSNNSCISCNEKGKYYKEYKDNYNTYVNCLKNPEGYYLENKIYKQCYYTCKRCNKQGNNITHNCAICDDNYPSEYIFDNNTKNCYKNCSLEKYNKYEYKKLCYEKCPLGTEISKEKNNHCEIICNEEKPFKKISTQECVENCDIEQINNKECILEYSLNNSTEEDNKTASINKEIKTQDIFLKNIEKSLTSGNFNTSKIENGIDEIIQNEKITITLTTTENQNNNNDSNITSINLGKCEDRLRDVYNISKEEKIFIKKIDIKQKYFKTPKIEYDIYSKLNSTNLIKLNISYCQNIKIDMFIPLILNESLDKLNPKSDYYNNFCYGTTSESGTDIILKDRQKEFINNNRTICQEKCDLIDYNNINKKVKCQCDIQNSSNSYSDMQINITEIYQNFLDIKNIINFNILICYKELLSKNGIIYNIGSYMILSIIFIHLISIIIFYSNQLNQLKDKIQKIIYGIKNWELVKNEETKKLTTQNNKNKKVRNLILKNNKRKNTTKNRNKKSNPPVKRENKRKNTLTLQNNFKNLRVSKQPKNKNLKSSMRTINKSQNKETIKKVKEIMSFNDKELNNLPYELATKHDKRTYSEYYISLLKTKHLLIFSFFYNNDYNSKIIKIDIFFINFSIYFFVNALFFNDTVIHNIYLNKGKYKFLYQLPKIIYSFLISAVLNAILKELSLSEGDIIKFKEKKDKNNLEKNKDKLYSKLYAKFILFFIFGFILLLFLWYYLSMFCVIYKNTQLYLIKDTIISFIFSLFYPFLIYLIPGLFRINSLSDKKNNKKYLYSFSKFIQVF